ncbi:MAG: protein kinase [Polyangiales bacterium]
MTVAEPPREKARDRIATGRIVNGRFRIIDVLGEGGMGVVYRAEQIPLGREVALKVLRMKGIADESFRRRFFLEASLTSQINHRNLVTIFDYGRIEDADDPRDESYFLSMELVRGVSLHERISTRGALAPSEAVSIAQEILRGLRVVHKHGIVHRDLKPANVMLVPNDEGRESVKVLDFGLVKQIALPKDDTSGPLTQQGAFLGTPEYMSPEHMDPQDVDERSDLYSVGVILFEMLTGKPPFQSRRPLETVLAHLTHPIPELRARNDRCTASSQLESVLRSLLEKTREQRCPSADAALEALAKVPEAAPSSSLTDERAPIDHSVIEAPLRYTVGAKVRTDPNSTWYEAMQPTLERAVLAQVFQSTNTRVLNRLRRGWSVLGALKHRNNPRVLDAGEGLFRGQRVAFIIYEKPQGETLEAELSRGARLAHARATQIMIDLLAALAEAHSLGLVHGALRPEAVVLQSDDGRARIAEYELDAATGSSSSSFPPLDPKRLQYFAPEVIYGARRSERADLFSVGAMLFHCLTGQPLKRKPGRVDGNTDSNLRALASSSSNVEGELPSALVQIVLRAIEDNPANRFESAREFMTALAATLPRARHSRTTLSGLQTVRWSQEPVSLWVLDSDPVFSRPMVRTALESLRQSMEVRVIPTEQREIMARLLREEKVVPPWAVIYGDMDVILEDRLLAVLGATGEVSRVLLSTHANVEMIQRSVNFCGCDQQLALPVTAPQVCDAINGMIERTRGIREHYDRLRLVARVEGGEATS